MKDLPMAPDNQALRELIEARIAQDPKARIFPVMHQGRRYWVKLPRIHEKLKDWLRGHPDKLMARELADLRALEALGQPVPKVVIERDGYFVTADNGIALDILWRERPEEMPELVRQAAVALAGLHACDCIHGAPHLRNLTKIEGGIGFIDIERAIIGKATLHDQAWDIGKFFYVLFGMEADRALIDEAIRAYREERGDDALIALERHLRRLRRWRLPLKLLAWHERRWRPDRMPKIYHSYLQVMDLKPI